MNGTQNFNLNECFRTINNIGSTTYQNICDGTVNVVPWGTGDWMGIIVLGFFVFIVMLFFLFIVIDIIKY